MRSFLFSALLGVGVLAGLLSTDSPAQAQRRSGVGVYVGPQGAGVYYGPSRGYYDSRYYGNRSYGYGNRYYDSGYYSNRYDYPSRTSYYSGPAASRYYYYWTNGWYVSRDRYTGDYWYRDGGSWYRWR